MNLKKGNSLYSIFIINSIVAVIIFILGIVVFFNLLFFKIHKIIDDKYLEIHDNKINYLFMKNYNDLDISKILSEDGWIEEIKNGEVVSVQGIKKDKKNKYLIEDLINEQTQNKKYETRAYKQGDKLYIVKIPNYQEKLINKIYANQKGKIYIIMSLILTIIIVSVMFLIVAIISIKRISKPLKILENEINKMSEGYSNLSVN